MLIDTDVDVAERLLMHLRNGTTDMAEAELRLPVWHFFDDERARAERRVFVDRPVLAAHRSSLPEVGQFLTLDLLGVPVLLVRQADGSVAGFRNVCRHRGGRVEQDVSGSHRVFTCRYHGWTYDADGTLRNIPYADGFPTVDKSCNGLVPIATAERHGLIFVQLESTDALDIVDYLGEELDTLLGAYDIASWELYVDELFPQPMNWKLIADGLLDILHPKFLHPESVGRLIQTNTHTWDPFGPHGRLSMARRKLDAMREEVPDGTDLRKYVITNFFIYPNTMLVLQPDHIELWSVYPDAESAGAVTTAIRFLAPGDPAPEEKARLDQSWQILRDAVLHEDWPMALSIHHAAKFGGLQEFVYGRNELPVQHLHRHLAADVAAVTAGEPVDIRARH